MESRKTRISLQLTAPMRTENARTAPAVRAFDFGDQPMPPEEIVEFKLDEPFLFAITGADGLPLFVGIVNQVG